MLNIVRTLCLALAVMAVALPAQAAGFAFETWFAGRTKATGSFSAINGVKRNFTVDLRGKWNGKTLTLREDFVFDDGERDTKTWRFTKIGEGRYEGTREDVVGKTQVTIKGNVARFAYQVYLDGKKRENLVRFSDVMTLKPDGTVVNTATVTKYGIPIARTKVVFRR